MTTHTRLSTSDAVAAARAGDVATLMQWLEHGGDPNQFDDEGWAPLLAAASRGNANVVDLLLNHAAAGVRHADPELRYRAADALPIFMAGQSGDLDTVKLLLRHSPHHLFEISRVNGHTVLLQAAFFGSQQHLQLARYLLEEIGTVLGLQDTEQVAHARWRLTVATNMRGFNALGVANLWHNQPMAELIQKYDNTTPQECQAYYEDLLIQVATPQSLTERLLATMQNGFERMAAMAEASTAEASQVHNQVMQQIRRLVEAPGFDVNRLGGALQQPPLVAAITGTNVNDHVAILRRTIVTYLLQNGADPDLPEEHPMAVDAVIRAAVLHHLDILKIIRQFMAPAKFADAMNAKPAINGLTALHDSVHRALTAPPDALAGHLEQIRWMVENGARSDIAEHTGKTQQALARSALADSTWSLNAKAVIEALNVSTSISESTS